MNQTSNQTPRTDAIGDNVRGASQFRQLCRTLERENAALRAALAEVMPEIQRLNRAAGETVFNPAATDMVRVALAGGAS